MKLQEKINIIGQELDCKVIDNERYRLALKLACVDILERVNYCNNKIYTEKDIESLISKFLLEAKEG